MGRQLEIEPSLYAKGGKQETGLLVTIWPPIHFEKKKTIFLFSIYKKPQAHYHIPFQVQGICRAIGEQHFWMHGIPFVAQLYSDGITSRPLKDS